MAGLSEAVDEAFRALTQARRRYIDNEECSIERTLHGGIMDAWAAYEKAKNEYFRSQNVPVKVDWSWSKVQK